MQFFKKQKIVTTFAGDDIPESYRIAQSTEYLVNQAWACTATEQIRSLVALPPRYFSLFYGLPLAHFFALTQPCNNTIIREHLQTVVNGLKLRRAFILPKGVDPESIREKKDRWTYAVFITLIMYDLVALVKPMSIYKMDAPGNKISLWSPVANDLPSLPYAFKSTDTTSFSRTVTPLLLRYLFDETCLSWLCEDSEAFNNALESMVRPQATSSIGPLVINVLNLENKFFESDNLPTNNVEAESTLTSAESLTDVPVLNPQPSIQSDIQSALTTGTPQKNKLSARSTGKCFHNWLIATINDENQPLQTRGLIHSISQGLALSSPAIFQYYATITNSEWKSVQNGFLKLRLHQSNPSTHEPLHTIDLANGNTISAIVMSSLTER